MFKLPVPRLASCCMLTLLLVASTLDAAESGWQPRPQLLVAPAWLEAHQADPMLRVVDVRAPEAYGQGHVPGAVNLPANELSATVDGIPGMTPPTADLARRLGAAGIGPEHTVVAYDAADGLYAARLFWVLEYLGHADVRLLDGGWPLWQRQARPVSRTPAALETETFPVHRQPDRIADLTWMREHLDDPATIYVDARSTWEFRGVTRYARHRGHIPGAVHVEWKEHLRGDGTLRGMEELRELYTAAGVTPDKAVAVYCQVHVRASHSYFVLRWLGHSAVRGYDGSWAEWGNRDDTPTALF